MTDEERGMTDEERGRCDVLLAEYHLAQQSAEHHDTLLWEVTSIIWGANTLMLGFAFEANPEERTIQIRILAGAVIGLGLSIFAHINARINKAVRTRKYGICQSIERELPLKLEHRQHCLEVERYRGSQTEWHLGVTAAFVLAWLVVAFQAVCRIYRH